MPRSLFFVFVFGFMSCVAFGQRVVVKKSPVKIATVESIKRSDARFALGTDVGSIMIGYFPVTAEYRITDWFTLEVNGGLASRNYFKSLLGKEFGGFHEGSVKLGYGFGAISRLFFEKDAFDDGFYMGFTYRRLAYFLDFEETWISFFQGVTTQVQGSRDIRFQEFGLIAGKEWAPAEKVMLDFYIGFGLAKTEIYVESDSDEYNSFNGGLIRPDLPFSFIFGAKASWRPF